MLLGLGGNHGPQPGHAGCPSLRAGFKRNLFLFGWTHWPLSLNKGTRVQPALASLLCPLGNSMNQTRTKEAKGRSLNSPTQPGSAIQLALPV